MRTHILPDVINYTTIKDHLLATGHLEGERAVLRRQIARRFGPLTEEQNKRIDAADEPTLAGWSEDIFDARSAAELLG